MKFLIVVFLAFAVYGVVMGNVVVASLASIWAILVYYAARKFAANASAGHTGSTQGSAYTETNFRP
jgi:hypothetical protein